MDDKVLSIIPDVYWVGVLDKDLVTFDIVMETQYGSTYNAYFINAGKKTVIDTVKEKFSEVFIRKLSRLTDPAAIEYIICNHTEPDHAGSVKHLLNIAPQATVVGSGQALVYLKEMIGHPFKTLQVKDGDVLDLGGKTLHFISAPNLHWPDTIYTFLEEDNLLFTCDSFGAHYCHPAMFDDEVGDYHDAFKYYFDVILRPYSRFMLQAIEKIKDREFTAVCPGHGPVLRTTWKEKIKLSREYAENYLKELQDSKKRILIAYVSAYGYTKEMVDYLAEGIKQVDPAIEIEKADIEHILPGDLEAKLIGSTAWLIGSPTINQNTLLPVYKLFGLVNPVRDRGKLAGAFGSFGWSGEAVSIIEGILKSLKLKVFPSVNARFYPTKDKAVLFVEHGKKFAEELKKQSIAPSS